MNFTFEFMHIVKGNLCSVRKRLFVQVSYCSPDWINDVLLAPFYLYDQHRLWKQVSCVQNDANPFVYTCHIRNFLHCQGKRSHLSVCVDHRTEHWRNEQMSAAFTTNFGGGGGRSWTIEYLKRLSLQGYICGMELRHLAGAIERKQSVKQIDTSDVYHIQKSIMCVTMTLILSGKRAQVLWF